MSRKPLWRVLVERTVSSGCRTLPEGLLAFAARSLGFKWSTHLPMRALVNSGEVVLQSGCWRTETLVGWSLAVGPQGHVIAVEADPTNADVLKLEAERRELENVTVVERALYSEPTTIELQVSDQSRRNKLRDTDTFSPRNPDSNYEEDVTVNADTVDAVVDEVGVGSPDHMHLEVSGAERKVLEGMTESLQSPGIRLFVRAILLDEETGRPMNELVARHLRDAGFQVTLARREPARDDGGNVYAARL